MKFISILIIQIFLFILSCRNESDSCHKKIHFINDSDFTVYLALSYYYPQDTLTQRLLYDPKNQEEIYRVDPGSVNDRAMYQKIGCWEGNFTTHEVLMLFVYHKDTIESYDFIDVMKTGKFTKRYDLTYDSLQKMNWEINFDY